MKGIGLLTWWAMLCENCTDGRMLIAIAQPSFCICAQLIKNELSANCGKLQVGMFTDFQLPVSHHRYIFARKSISVRLELMHPDFDMMILEGCRG